MLLHVVTHCYSVQIPDFAHLLTAQLSSLYLCPPARHEVLVTVVTSEDDAVVRACVRDFRDRYRDADKPVQIEELVLPHLELFRRAIGRNIVAKRSKADVVWWADCDYAVNSGFVDYMLECRWPSHLVFPSQVMVHNSHEAGDAEIARIKPGQLHHLDRAPFKPQRIRVCIGGLQFAQGDLARKGYLDNTRWTKPLDKFGSGFRDTTEDKIYRGAVLDATPITTPQIFRLRHSRSAFQAREKRVGRRRG